MRRVLSAAIFATALAGLSSAEAATSGYGWRRGVSLAGQASMVLRARDPKFALELSCALDPKRRLRFSLFLYIGREWTYVSEILPLWLDGSQFSMEVGGSEDGVSLADAVEDNAAAMSSEAFRRITAARTIEIPGKSERSALPDILRFDNDGPESQVTAFRNACARIGSPRSDVARKIAPGQTTSIFEPLAAAAPATPEPAAPAAAPVTSPVETPAVVAAAPTPTPAAPAEVAPPVEPVAVNRTGGTPAGRYLFDIVKLQPYASTWKSLLGRRPPRWLASLNGPATPSTAVTIGGESFELADICEAHNCMDATFVVLFSADGRRAVGMLRENRAVSYLGNPTAEQRRVMLQHK